MAVRYLEARPEALLVEPADAVDVMRREAANWTKIGTRVIAVDLKVGEKGRWGLEGIPVSACRTVHSGDREAPMNLMYVFELNGRRVWHEGDTNGKPEVFLAFGTLTPDVVVSGTYSMGSSGRGEATITIGASTLEYAIYAASGRLMVFVPRGTNNECDIGFASRVF